ncbi:MAG: hypothetical protein K2N51_08840 [Lachnospiraceae bacterium]|nr:hypothetical protein [Lachnospiraceae bacterium]
MGDIKKITIRLNLQNSTDARIWDRIEKQIQQKKGNNYLKDLILLGLKQEEQAVVLEEIREIKQMLKGSSREWNLEEKEETAGLKETERLQETVEEIPEQIEEHPEPVEDESMEKEVSIAPDVMNFLDTL